MNNYKKFYPYIAIGLLSFILNIMLHSFGAYNFIESKLYDMKFKLRGPQTQYYSSIPSISVSIEAATKQGQENLITALIKLSEDKDSTFKIHAREFSVQIKMY